jgi:DNA-binding transcriptional LysR family regulator
VRVHLYASPEYLKKHGTPRRPEDLDQHRIVVYGDEARAPISNINWLLEAGTKPGQERRPILQVNNTYGLFRAVSSGVGIAALPDYVAVEGPELVRILPELTGPPVEAYFVYPEELRTSKRISVFRDFLIRKVTEARAV